MLEASTSSLQRLVRQLHLCGGALGPDAVHVWGGLERADEVGWSSLNPVQPQECFGSTG
jgi:hypothetical protein